MRLLAALLLCACGSVASDLTVTVEGDGEVTSAPTGIACPSASCVHSFASGDDVTLNATPASGNSFAGWSGGCPAGRAPCALALNDDTIVAARFAPQGAMRWIVTAGAPGGVFGSILTIGTRGQELAVAGYVTGPTTLGGMAISTGRFIAKLDAQNGQALWVRPFAGTLFWRGIRIDPAGDVVVAATYLGTTDLGAGTISSTGDDAFVVKYRGVDGGYVWSRHIAGTSADIVGGAALDAAGDVYVSGTSFSPGVDLGAGALTNTGQMVFAARYRNDTGAHVWNNWFPVVDDADLADLDVDGAGNVVVVGEFLGMLNLDGNLLLGNGTDMLMAKFDGATGAVLFAKKFGAAGGELAREVAVDEQGNILVAGAYSGAADVGGPPLPARTHFVAKYSTAGAHVWSGGFSFGGTSASVDLAADRLGDAIVGGRFSGTATFGGISLTAAGGVDAVIVKLAAATGEPIWAKGYGGTTTDVAGAVTVGELDRIYVGGNFGGFANFDGQTITAAGDDDVFVVELEP